MRPKEGLSIAIHRVTLICSQIENIFLLLSYIEHKFVEPKNYRVKQCSK